MTTNHLEKIDPAIYRAGRVDGLVEMKKCDHTQIKKIFKKCIDRNIKEEVLEKILEYKYSPADIIFHLKNNYMYYSKVIKRCKTLIFKIK